MITEAIVLAGGFGTRLQKVVQDIPKPMAPILGRPFLEFQLNYLKSFGIKKVIFSVGYLSEQIITHFKNHFQGIDIDYAVEETPLGTGGGILKSFSLVSGAEALVVNGDTLFEVDLHGFYAAHQKSNSLFSIALRQLEEVGRYGSVMINADNRICKFAEKGLFSGAGLINGGVYLIHHDFFRNNILPERFSMEKDVFEPLVNHRAFYGFPFNAYFLDIGIPEDYQKAQDEFQRFSY
jgi:D-glycero-alpha-D-manno-heptose 1-phosphate guanylyltransferase